MKALILAAGRGKRLEDWTENKNKSMIKLFEKPIIEYNLEHAIEIGAKEIIIVIGYKGEEIKKFFGKEYKGVPIKYILQKEQRGLVHAVECAKEAIGDSDFLLMLADEIVPESKIKEMAKKFREEDLFVICGIVNEKQTASIGKTYSAMVNEKNRVFRLIEKPKVVINKIKGTGHCILKNEMLNYIERTPINANRGERELVDWIQVAVDDGKQVYVYPISRIGYVNVNTKEDYDLSKELLKKTNPRVLIVHTQMKFLGGAELLIVELCNWLTKLGIKNDILALSKSKEVENSLIDTEIIIPKHDIDLRPPGFRDTGEILQFIKIFRKKLKKIIKNYDVVNFHNFPVTWTLFPRKKPCVWMLNEPPNLWSKPNAGLLLKTLNKTRNWLDKFIVRNSVDIICTADEFNKTRAEKRYKGNSRIIYYGVNHDFFSKGKAEKAKRKFNLKNNFVVLQSGMIIDTKNQLESVKTIKKVKERIPNVLLLLAGKVADEKYKKVIDDYIKENNLEKNVLFTGNLSREELRDLYKASDVGLFPIGKQGGWLAPFEMLCSGKPIIVSEDMGAASLIKEFNLGTTTKDYASSLLEIHNNNKNYNEQAKNASLFVKKNLSWKIFTEKMIKAYKNSWGERGFFNS